MVRINAEIFNSVSKDTKSEDVLLQCIQKPLIAGVTVVTSLLDKIIKAEKGEKEVPDVSETLSYLSDAISLLTDASHELDLCRRAAFCPNLKEDIWSLCGDTEPVTTLLFGKDLGGTVKTLTDTSKVNPQLMEGAKRSMFSGSNTNSRRHHNT